MPWAKSVSGELNIYAAFQGVNEDLLGGDSSENGSADDKSQSTGCGLSSGFAVFPMLVCVAVVLKKRNKRT